MGYNTMPTYYSTAVLVVPLQIINAFQLKPDLVMA